MQIPVYGAQLCYFLQQLARSVGSACPCRRGVLTGLRPGIIPGTIRRTWAPPPSPGRPAFTKPTPSRSARWAATTTEPAVDRPMPRRSASRPAPPPSKPRQSRREVRMQPRGRDLWWVGRWRSARSRGRGRSGAGAGTGPVTSTYVRS